MSAYRKKILELLKKGYNPFEDNTELYQKHKELENTKKATPKDLEPDKKTPSLVPENTLSAATNQKTIEEAFEFALLIKKKIVGTRTYSGYSSKSKALQLFINKNYTEVIYINQLTKNILI